jgi:ArsR family transcriptional regulator
MLQASQHIRARESLLLMDASKAVSALSALAHAGRLEVFRLLIRAGKEGMASGEIARATGHVPQTLSGNLGVLDHAGLVSSHREGRSIIYTANYDAMTSLLGFLMEDCCGGVAEICAPLAELAAKSACCQPNAAQ